MYTKKPSVSRKLLVAAAGVATINFLALACGGKAATSGNLMAGDASETDALPPLPPPTSGNLMPPPLVDASDDADAGEDDGGDGGDPGDAGDGG